MCRRDRLVLERKLVTWVRTCLKVCPCLESEGYCLLGTLSLNRVWVSYLNRPIVEYHFPLWPESRSDQDNRIVWHKWFHICKHPDPLSTSPVVQVKNSWFIYCKTIVTSMQILQSETLKCCQKHKDFNSFIHITNCVAEGGQNRGISLLVFQTNISRGFLSRRE